MAKTIDGVKRRATIEWDGVGSPKVTNVFLTSQPQDTVDPDVEYKLKGTAISRDLTAEELGDGLVGSVQHLLTAVFDVQIKTDEGVA